MVFASFVAITSVSSPAGASAFDVSGFGPAGVAEINARCARADDGTAAFYNPGGLGLGRGYHVEIAPQLGASALSAQGNTKSIEGPFGVALALDATLPFKGALADRLRFGFGGYFLPDGALRLIARSAEEPLFPYYDNRSQRLVLLLALAAKITDRLAVGASVNVLGGVSGSATVHPGASGAPEPRIDVNATTRVAANVGLRFDVAPHLRFGFTYRQRFAVPAVIATDAEVGGVPIGAAVSVREALFDPHTFVLASSFDLGRATFEIDASYAAWSSYAGPFVDVRAELPGVLAVSPPPPPLYRDVVSVRAAAAYRFSLSARTDLILSGGAGFEPSMLKGSQQGLTNLVDGHKVLIGVGASLVIRGVFPRPIRLGFGQSAQILTGFEQDKRGCVALPCPPHSVVGPDASNPGQGITNPGYPKLEAGGAFLSTSFGLGVDL